MEQKQEERGQTNLLQSDKLRLDWDELHSNMGNHSVNQDCRVLESHLRNVWKDMKMAVYSLITDAPHSA